MRVKDLQVGMIYAEVQTGYQVRVERKGLLRRKIGVSRRLTDTGTVFYDYKQISNGLLRELTNEEDTKIKERN